jgi:hypothetical protein
MLASNRVKKTWQKLYFGYIFRLIDQAIIDHHQFSNLKLAFFNQSRVYVTSTSSTDPELVTHL